MKLWFPHMTKNQMPKSPTEKYCVLKGEKICESQNQKSKQFWSAFIISKELLIINVFLPNKLSATQYTSKFL
jgi:hypothetical protein